MRRLTGKSLGTFFQEEIATPLKADFYIGVPESEFSRIGLLIPAGDGSAPIADEIRLLHVLCYPLRRQPSHGRKVGAAQKFQRLTVILMRGQSLGASAAGLQGVTFGVDLLSKETAESVMRARISGTDLVLGVPIAYGLGFDLNSEVMPLSPNQNTCFWGRGGSSVVVDQDASLSASFVMNKMFWAGGRYPVLWPDAGGVPEPVTV